MIKIAGLKKPQPRTNVLAMFRTPSHSLGPYGEPAAGRLCSCRRSRREWPPLASPKEPRKWGSVICAYLSYDGLATYSSSFWAIGFGCELQFRSPLLKQILKQASLTRTGFFHVSPFPLAALHPLASDALGIRTTFKLLTI